MGRKGCAEKSSNFVCFFFAMLLSAWLIMFTGIVYASPYYIPLPSGPRDIAVNPDTGKIYVATGSDVTVIDGADNSTTSVASVAAGYNNLAVNRSANRIYAASEDNGVSLAVIDGTDESFEMMTITGTAGYKPAAMALSEKANKVYLVYQDPAGTAKMAVIDGATQTVAASVYTVIDVGAYPSAIAVNETVNRVYIANFGSDDSEKGSVTVVDAVYNAVIATVTVGYKPVEIAVNENTNKIYVVNYGITEGSAGTVSVIDGKLNTATAPVDVGTNPCSLAVNRATNKIYVANSIYYSVSGSSSYVTCIDGKNNGTIFINPSSNLQPRKIIVNENANEIYVANDGESISIIDGATNDISFIQMESNRSVRRYMAFDASSGRIYVTCGFGDSPVEYKVAVIDPLTLDGAATNGNGTVVILDFGSRMADPSGKHGQFEALVDGEIRNFSAAALHPGDDTRMDLFLDGEPITRENTVKISYMEGDVRDKAGHTLQSFHDVAVANKVVGFDIGAPQNVKAGTPFNITITAKNLADYPPTQAFTYNGTKILTYGGPGLAPGGQAPSYTNETSFNSGYSFGIPITLFRAETATLTVSDAGATGSTVIPVAPADISYFEVTIQTEGNPMAGIPFGVMLKATDAYGNLATGYNGTHNIIFKWNAAASPDGTNPVKPAGGDVVFTGGIAIVGGFMPACAGEKVVVTATDESGHTGSASAAVGPGPAASLTITAPQEISAGGEFAGRLVVKDALGNIAAGYAGTVHLTCTDGKAVFREDCTFTGADGGIKDFKMTMKTSGTHTITVQDTEAETLSATRTINVNPGPLDPQKSEANAYPEHVPADGMTSSVITVILKDSFANPLSGHTVALRQDGGSSQITPDEGISDNDGKVVFAVSNNKVETVTYTAIDATGHDAVVGSARVLFASTNANLEGILLSSGSLTPGFDPEKTEYTADVAAGVEGITVTPATEDDNASVAVNGIPAVNGQASDMIDLDPGSNIITITVTAQDGITTKTYTVTVTRAEPPGGDGKDGEGDSGGTDDESDIGNDEGDSDADSGESNDKSDENNDGSNNENEPGNNAGDDTGGRDRRHASKSTNSPAIIQGAVDPTDISTLESSDKTIRLDFPPGFMTVPAGTALRVTVKEIAGKDFEDLIQSAMKPEGFKYAVKALELTAKTTPEGKSVPVLSFDKPVILTVGLGDRDIEGVKDLEKLGLFKVEDDGSLSFAGGKVINDTLAADVYVAGLYVLGEVDITFEDVKGHWAKEDIELMASKRIVRGFPGGNFEPEDGVTRAQFAAMLVRAMDLPVEKQGMSFIDVKPGDWCRDELQAAITAGIVTGFDDGSFKPEAPVTREQAASMLIRALKAGGAKKQNSVPEVSAVSTFTDTETISSWAKGDLSAAVEQGILKGLPAGTLGPQSQVTRAQAAVMIARLWEQF